MTTTQGGHNKATDADDVKALIILLTMLSSTQMSLRAEHILGIICFVTFSLILISGHICVVIISSANCVLF